MDPKRFGNRVLGRAVEGGALKAFRVSDGAERTIDTGKAYQAASRAPAGDELYYVADVSPSINARAMRLYEASSGRELASMGDLTSFAVNPDGQRIAFARGRPEPAGLPVRSTSQTFILNVADGRLSELVPCRIPLRFSPDGSQLLCQTGKYEYRVEPAIVDLATGASAALPERFGNLIGVGPAHFGVDLNWTSSGLRAVYRSDTSSVEVVVENSATGDRTILRADGVPGIIVNQPIWSPDGTLVAFAKEECHDSEPVCDRRVRLIVADVGRGWSNVIAVGRDVVGAIAFSNDARRIAYVLDGAVRLRRLRW